MTGRQKKSYFKSKSILKTGMLRNYTVGMKGFMCTCGGNYKDALREAMNILEEYHAIVYPPAKEKEEGKSKTSIEEDLATEIQQLKNRESNKFELMATGSKSCFFIKTTIESPTELCEAICKDLHEKKLTKAKHLLRLIPIEATCKAYVEYIKILADGFLDRHFICAPTSYSIVVNLRNNNSVVKDELISSLALLVRDKNPSHRVDLNNSEKTIIIDIMKAVCGISVVKNYHTYKKLNLSQIGK